MKATLDYERIRQLKIEIDKSKIYLPKYHIYPRSGLLNDPNGLFFDGHQYHVFYQWHPYGANHGLKHWEYLTTKDFISFRLENPIIPTLDNETHGCYSGGGIALEKESIIFYTANKRIENNHRKSSQVVAKVKDGKIIDKKIVVENTPTKYTDDFRDPNPYIEKDGSIGVLIGARKKNGQGVVVKYQYDNMTQQLKLLGELMFVGVDINDTYMWECPNLYRSNKTDIFIGCPQGIRKEKYQYHNIYSTVYIAGQYQGDDFQVEKMEELDNGFDFYAPQLINGIDELVILGWIGTPEMTYPTDRYQWHSAITLPRRLTYIDGIMVQYPWIELSKMIKNKESYDNVMEISTSIQQSYVKLNGMEGDFKITLKDTSQTHNIEIGYTGKCFYIDRSNTILTDQMEKYGNVRSVEIEKIDSLELFIDHSIIELFINNGQKAMTLRYFTNSDLGYIHANQKINVEIYEITNIELWKESHYEKNT